MSVAFFSGVEVDRVLRKEAKSDCTTPSNPHGLVNGYQIPHGESLNIHEAIAKAGTDLSGWNREDNGINADASEGESLAENK